MEYIVINKLNLENLYKNGKGRRFNKRYQSLIFQKCGLKLIYEPDVEYYYLVETGIDPEEADWIYWYKNNEENSGEIILYDDSEDCVCFGIGWHIVWLDKYNFSLCIDK